MFKEKNEQTEKRQAILETDKEQNIKKKKKKKKQETTS